MWRPWSRPLELLGRIRLRAPRLWRRKLRVGDPSAPDATGGMGWREYLSSERLYEVWGPLPDGPWVPYHCVPLFAALDRIRRREIGPTPPPELGAAGRGARRRGGYVMPPHVRPDGRPPPWIRSDTWTILDLPGPASVEAAAWLVASAGCQPVCTFDNWPHRKGVLKAEDTLAELLRWATTVAEARQRLTWSSPPLWICDSGRLGTRAGRPGEFDNRYYLDDSILPGPGLLKREGIRRVVYVTVGGEAIPVLDLEEYFAELLAAGLPVLHAELMDPAIEPLAFSAPPRPRPPPRAGFRRSSAGGFGTEVPQPSSSGGG